MTILGIINRTENWKTARHFSPLFGKDASIHLARQLGEPRETEPSDVHLELYWKGLRDYLHKEKIKKESEDKELADRYSRLFPDLRDRIEGFYGFRDLKDHNYSSGTKGWEAKLRDNLVNTEIDIVLQTPTRLFIGEAKHEMGFGANGDLFLVHQLIRQFVMAKVLLDILGCTRKVIPFVVGDNAERLKKSHQVGFMVGQGWLQEENILEWRKIDQLSQEC